MKWRHWWLAFSLVFLNGCEPTLNFNFKANQQAASPAPGYPVTIATAHGDVTLYSKPERIVTLGASAEDWVVLLGEMPVAIEAHFWGGDKNGILPWFSQYLDKHNLPRPDIVSSYPELDVEKILAMKPDVILAPQSGMAKSTFEQLSTFVPVIAYPSRPWLTSSEQQLTMIAKALGQAEKIPELLTKRKSFLAGVGESHPDIQGLKIAYVNASSGAGNLSVYVEGDPRVNALLDMGMEIAPAIKSLTPEPWSFAAGLGMENADVLNDVDLVVSWYGSEQQRDQVGKIPLFAQIPAVKRGAYLAISDPAMVMAMSYGTPLSLEWAMEGFVPQLLEATRNAR